MKPREDPRLRVNVEKRGVCRIFAHSPDPDFSAKTGELSPVSDKRSPCGGILALLRVSERLDR